MAAGSIFKIIIKVGRSYFGTNSAKIADDLVKQGGKRIPKTKLPKSVNVKKAPAPKVPEVKLPLKKPTRADNLPNVKLRKDPPVGRKTTAPPNKSSQPKAPAKPKRTKPPLTRVPGRTNTPPKKINSGAAALTRGSTLEGGPEVKLSPTDKQKTDRKFVPKTTPKTKKTKPPLKKAPPRTAPASGPANNESFGKAFKRNRKAGNATFKWRDKEYTTRFKEETIAQHKKKFGVEGKY